MLLLIFYFSCVVLTRVFIRIQFVEGFSLTRVVVFIIITSFIKLLFAVIVIDLKLLLCVLDTHSSTPNTSLNSTKATKISQGNSLVTAI